MAVNLLERLSSREFLTLLVIAVLAAIALQLLFRALNITSMPLGVLLTLVIGIVVGLFAKSYVPTLVEFLERDPTAGILGITVLFAGLGLALPVLSTFGAPMATLGPIDLKQVDFAKLFGDMVNNVVGFGINGLVFGFGLALGVRIRR